MGSALRSKISKARLRCSMNVLLEQFGLVFCAGGLIGVLAVVAERALAVRIIFDLTVYIWAGAIVAIGLVFWLSKLPSRMQTALLVDERLGLKERCSTALSMSGNDAPFVIAAKNQAEQVASQARLKGYFLIRPSKRWLYSGGIWTLVALAVLFMPELDLLGRDVRRRTGAEQSRQLAQAKEQIQQVTSRLEATIGQLDDAESSLDLSDLGKMLGDAKPEELRRQAIRKLGDLGEKIQKLQESERLAAVKAMREMLKQLRGPRHPLSQELQQALAKGQMGRAANTVRQIQEQLAQGQLDEQQRQLLADQLAELGKQLQTLAEQNHLLEEELERAGLEKRLAKLNEQELRGALKQAGLSDEQIEELVEKAAACRSACASCQGLGQAASAGGLGGGAGLNADELDELVEQLASLEALSQELALLNASLDEIERATACLGQGNCKGGACMGPYRPGLVLGQGGGTGSPGRGYGPRDTAESGTANFKKTRVKNTPGEGAVIASWYFKGPQIKTGARRGLAEVVQAAKDGAAEAISENQIPRKYEESVKRYFGQLEESVAK